ncbi:MAG: bacteriorhodopsin [Chloroflexi bacterium]|jgi:bacteriorhodopsin|nr:bacteriorhodopsin [Chloroflexota bacterium]
MPSLSIPQYDLVYNAFSFSFATMFAAFIFFVLVRTQLAPQYRGAMIMSALVVAVAGYHYFRIFESWSAAFTLSGGRYIASGKPFNDAYRYIDWLLTVPLLVTELIYVINPRNRGRLAFTLATAAALMVILGYPGEIATDNGTRALWGFLSTIPFVYIVYTLFTGLGEAMKEQTPHGRVLIRNTRLLLLATWGFYPIVYLLPILGVSGAAAVVAVQVGYCIADVAAKAGYGLMIYAIANEKSKAAGWKYDSSIKTAAGIID